jgi:hypothetical protein
MKTLHLMTQRDQPYGSQRRCCEECGLMMVARPTEFWHEHTWTDDQAEYRHHAEWSANGPDELMPCRPTLKPLNVR